MPASNRRQIELGEVLDAQAFALLGSIYKIWPGIVTAYHASSAGSSPPEVDVQPAVNDVRIDTELGTLVSEPWPVISRVPVAMFKAGGFAILAPLKAGDVVTLLGYDLDPTAFRSSGNQSDPIDTRRHGAGYWVALPFDITDPGALTDPGANLQVIAPSGGKVVFGAGATDAPALASIVDANFSAIITFLKKIFPTPGTPTSLIAPSGGGTVTSPSGGPVPSVNATASQLILTK